MRRPYRALCGIVLGLAVLVGCSKKPKSEPVASGNADPAPAPVAPPKPQPVPGTSDKNQSTTSTGWAGVVNAVATASASAPAPTTVPGSVELLQCRFDTVEGALAAAKGKVVFVDCWARWCPPCIDSFPKLVEKHEKYGPKGLVCMSVSIDSGRKAFTPEQVHSFLKEKNALFQNFYLTDSRADNQKMVERFGYQNSIPHAALFSKQGVKVWDGHPLNLRVAMIESELAK